MNNSNVFSELTNLQNELARLTSAVQTIDKAKQTAADVVQTAESLNKSYNQINQDAQVLHSNILKQTEQLKKLIAELDKADLPQLLDKFEELINAVWLDTQDRLKAIQFWLYLLAGMSGLIVVMVLIALVL